MEYCVEAVGDQRTASLRTSAVEHLQRLGELGWVLIENQTPVAYSTFNAQFGGVVQVGGVYTPPAFRRQGYGRAVVAASLLDARRSGASKSVLFTAENNVAARRAYEALGYTVLADFSLMLFV